MKTKLFKKYLDLQKYVSINNLTMQLGVLQLSNKSFNLL